MTFSDFKFIREEIRTHRALTNRNLMATAGYYEYMSVKYGNEGDLYLFRKYYILHRHANKCLGIPSQPLPIQFLRRVREYVR